MRNNPTNTEDPVNNVTKRQKPPKVKKTKTRTLPQLTRKAVSVEGFVTLAVILAIFIPIGVIMGFGNMLNTIFNNAYDLLINTCFYLMAISVFIGALSSVLTEFGVVSLFNKAASPLMKPIYGLPGAASAAMFSSFLSDNPAVLTLAADSRYRRYFKKYQLAALTNFGTSFGMGLIVILLMLQKGTKGDLGSVGIAVAAGVIASVLGSILTTRLMLAVSKKKIGAEDEAYKNDSGIDYKSYREVREGGIMQRVFSSILEGGESGVKIGLAIIPGVLIIANIVKLLTGGMGVVDGVEKYTGAAGEGVGLLIWIGEKLSVVFKALFGFENPSSISIPLTALGSAGAALSLIENGMFTANEIAVFTSMCMFWSGYLSTHVSMMDNMGFRKLTSFSILFHTIGGMVAGICSHFLYIFFALFL